MNDGSRHHRKYFQPCLSGGAATPKDLQGFLI